MYTLEPWVDVAEVKESHMPQGKIMLWSDVLVGVVLHPLSGVQSPDFAEVVALKDKGDEATATEAKTTRFTKTNQSVSRPIVTE